MKHARAAALLALVLLCSGCARTPEQKAQRTVTGWLRDLQNGKTVSSPENTSLLAGFENLNLEALSEEDRAFEQDYLKSVVRSWDVVSAYQQDEDIIVCVLVNFADPDSLTKERLSASLKEHPDLLEAAEEAAEEETEEAGQEASEPAADAEDAESEGQSESEPLIGVTLSMEDPGQLEQAHEALKTQYLKVIQDLVLQTAKEAPEMAREVYFQVDPETQAILSVS